MNIDELLNKYFEGETTSAEESQLRAFFASDDVPEHLSVYKPLFAYFREEIGKQAGKPAKTVHRSIARRTVLYLVSGIAACVLLALGIGQLLHPLDPCFCSDNYVVINGRCYTDIYKVRTLAIEALQEVATPADEYFPETDSEPDTQEIVDNQLKELGSLFSDDE